MVVELHRARQVGAARQVQRPHHRLRAHPTDIRHRLVVEPVRQLHPLTRVSQPAPHLRARRRRRSPVLDHRAEGRRQLALDERPFLGHTHLLHLCGDLSAFRRLQRRTRRRRQEKRARGVQVGAVRQFQGNLRAPHQLGVERRERPLDPCVQPVEPGSRVAQVPRDGERSREQERDNGPFLHGYDLLAMRNVRSLTSCELATVSYAVRMWRATVLQS